jgi:hypothetical protein
MDYIEEDGDISISFNSEDTHFQRAFCAQHIIESFTSSYLDSCDCPYECQKSTYSLKASSTLISKENVSIRLRPTRLNIFFEEVKETVNFQVAQFHLADFFVNFGCQLGFFFILCLLHVVDVVYLLYKIGRLFYFRLRYKALRKGKQHANVLGRFWLLLIETKVRFSNSVQFLIHKCCLPVKRKSHERKNKDLNANLYDNFCYTTEITLRHPEIIQFFLYSWNLSNEINRVHPDLVGPKAFRAFVSHKKIVIETSRRENHVKLCDWSMDSFLAGVKTVSQDQGSFLVSAHVYITFTDDELEFLQKKHAMRVGFCSENFYVFKIDDPDKYNELMEGFLGFVDLVSYWFTVKPECFSPSN